MCRFDAIETKFPILLICYAQMIHLLSLCYSKAPVETNEVSVLENLNIIIILSKYRMLTLSHLISTKKPSALDSVTLYS